MEPSPKKQNDSLFAGKKKWKILPYIFFGFLFFIILSLSHRDGDKTIAFFALAGVFILLVKYNITLGRRYLAEASRVSLKVANETRQIDEIDVRTREDVRKRFHSQTILVVCGSIILGVLLLTPVILWRKNILAGQLETLFLLPILLPFILIVVYFVYIMEQIQSILIQSFAKEFGFTYAEEGDVATVGGLILKGGHNQTMGYLLVGTFQNQQMRIYEFSQQIGYGRGSYIEVSTVFEVTLRANISHVALRPIGTIETAVHHSKETTLEGNFNDYFSLQIPEGFDSEVRVIFTPDIMQKCIEKFRHYRLEIKGDRLYIISSRITSRKRLLEVYVLAQHMAEVLILQIESVGEKK
jgi:hypothetical protein